MADEKKKAKWEKLVKGADLYRVYIAPDGTRAEFNLSKVCPMFGQMERSARWVFTYGFQRALQDKAAVSAGETYKDKIKLMFDRYQEMVEGTIGLSKAKTPKKTKAQLQEEFNMDMAEKMIAEGLAVELVAKLTGVPLDILRGDDEEAEEEEEEEIQE